MKDVAHATSSAVGTIGPETHFQNLICFFRITGMLCWRGRTLLLSRLSHPIRVRLVTLRGVAPMSTVPPAPAFKPFDLALIQLGQIGVDKRANLNHARDMIRRAARGEGVGGAQGKPDLIVLPVSTAHLSLCICPHQMELVFPEHIMRFFI